MNWRSILLQVPAYAAFAAFVGYFSTDPPYRQLAPGQAVVKLSIVHAGERREACHERSAAELAKLAPNMRAALDCPRERSDVRVEVEMDGVLLFRAAAPAAGVHHDLPSTIYRRSDVAAGTHVFRARLADGPGAEFTQVARARVELAPGRVLVIDYAAGAGGFQFRS